MLMSGLEGIIQQRCDGEGKDTEDTERAGQQDGLDCMEAHIAIFALVEIDQQPGDPPEKVAEPGGGLGGDDERRWPPGRRRVPWRVRGLHGSARPWTSHHRHDMRYRPLLPT